MDDTVKIIPLDFVNAYLVRAGAGWALIDTGLPGQWEQLEKELLAAGCLPDRLKLVIITHGDWDHTGNALRLREKYRATIAMHPGDLNQVENGVLLKRKIRPLAYRLIFLTRMLMRALNKNNVSFPRFTPDLLLADGQDLASYGLSARIIHIPGHTPGSIGILTGAGDFFAGDTFVNRKKPDRANIVENAQELETSLKKLGSQKIRMVYPGHGKPFMMDNRLCAPVR
jgi:hydroxyacylglutathione hydrolase